MRHLSTLALALSIPTSAIEISIRTLAVWIRSSGVCRGAVLARECSMSTMAILLMMSAPRLVAAAITARTLTISATIFVTFAIIIVGLLSASVLVTMTFAIIAVSALPVTFVIITAEEVAMAAVELLLFRIFLIVVGKVVRKDAAASSAEVEEIRRPTVGSEREQIPRAGHGGVERSSRGRREVEGRTGPGR